MIAVHSPSKADTCWGLHFGKWQKVVFTKWLFIGVMLGDSLTRNILCEAKMNRFWICFEVVWAKVRNKSSICVADYSLVPNFFDQMSDFWCVQEEICEVSRCTKTQDGYWFVNRKVLFDFLCQTIAFLICLLSKWTRRPSN